MKSGQYIYWKICQYSCATNAEENDENQPEPVLEYDELTISWEFTIHTDRNLNANSPEILIRDSKENMSSQRNGSASVKEYNK